MYLLRVLREVVTKSNRQFNLHALVRSAISETEERIKKQKFEKDKAIWKDRNKKSIKDGFKADSDAVKNAAIRSLGVQTENRSKLADTLKKAQTNLQSVIGKKPKDK